MMVKLFLFPIRVVAALIRGLAWTRLAIGPRRR
jgi:hypothetical protein